MPNPPALRLVSVCAALSFSAGCCPVDVETLDRPGGTVRVVDDGGRAIAGARVVLARFEVAPHFVSTPQATWDAVTGPDGTVSFTHGTTTQTQYPLLPHGVGFNAWHVCAEHPGHRTALAGWMIQAPPDGLNWEEYLSAGPNIDDLELRLPSGESTPCATALGSREPSPGEWLILGEDAPAGRPPPPGPPPPQPRLVAAEVGCDVWGGDGDGVPLIRHATLTARIENPIADVVHVETATWRLDGLQGDHPTRPVEIPSRSVATLDGRRPIDTTALAALDEGVDGAARRRPRALRVDLTWRVGKAPELHRVTFTEKVRWRSCFEAPDPPVMTTTPMPDVADAPATLQALGPACRDGSAPACTRLGDHYFSHVPGPRGRLLYARAADLDWAAAPTTAVRGGTSIRSQADAIARLRAEWPRLVGGMHTKAAQWATYHTAALMNAAVGTGHTQISAREVPCRDGYRWVHQLQHEHDGALKGAVLSGSLPELHRDGACWSVMLHGGMKGEILAYVGADDGRVLAVTRVPEG